MEWFDMLTALSQVEGQYRLTKILVIQTGSKIAFVKDPLCSFIQVLRHIINTDLPGIQLIFNVVIFAALNQHRPAASSPAEIGRAHV